MFLCPRRLTKFTVLLAAWIHRPLWSSPPLCASQRTSGGSLPPLLPIKLPRVYVNYSTRSASFIKVTWSISVLRILLASTSSISGSNPPIARPLLTSWSQSRTPTLVTFGKGSRVVLLEPQMILQGYFLKVILLPSTNKTWIHIGRISLEKKIRLSLTRDKQRRSMPRPREKEAPTSYPSRCRPGQS